MNPIHDPHHSLFVHQVAKLDSNVSKMKFIQIVITLILVSSSWTLNRSWWKHATIYEIFLKSFKDSNGDGIGDLKGITAKLDYLVDIGIDTIWVTPFYPSSGADGGYDITDYCAIDPIYGTMEDFEELLREMRIRDINFVMDLVINHSSDEHEWFQKSIKKIEPYKDYYIWRDPKGRDKDGNLIPPNNWVSMFNIRNGISTAWTWNEERKQFYFHSFGIKQPDLNLRNDNVKKQLKTLMKFWLDKGVAAFRLDATPFYMEDPLFRDNVYAAATAADRILYQFSHSDTFPFLNEFYRFLRMYDRKNKKQKETAMMAEAFGPIEVSMKYYGTPKAPVVHFPFNFRVTALRKYLDAQQMIDYLNLWLKRLPDGAANNWALGNHDQGRIFQRFSKEYNYILLALVTMLPGTSIIYYGEELSQESFDFAPDRASVRNPWVERDHFRSPMQWDSSLNAGFTSGDKPWVPLHPAYWYANVEAQRSQENSTLNYFKDLTSVRKTKTIKLGDLKLYPISKWVLAFTRTYRGSEYVIVLNLGSGSNLADLRSNINDLPPTLTVVAASSNSGYKKGEKFSTIWNNRNVCLLTPHSTLVLSFDKQ